MLHGEGKAPTAAACTTLRPSSSIESKHAHPYLLRVFVLLQLANERRA